MSAYVFPIKMAIITFPFLALLIALPFLIVQYRRYGSFTFVRALVLYSFVFYMLTAYFMIILPLPSVAAVAKLTTARYQLIPFTAVREFFNTSGFALASPGTWPGALRSASFLQPAFNMLLTLPFGFYLRYYFRRSWKQVLLMSFGLSLFFELTQLSGLYFIYPRPYRLFDVDDLIVNTLGGMLGYYLTPLIRRAFPSRERMDAQSYERGKKVGWLRRFVAFLVDYVVIGGIVRFLLELGLHALHVRATTSARWSYVLMIAIVFGLLAGRDGATLGKSLVRLRVTGASGETQWWRAPLRYALLYYFCLPIWQLWLSESSMVLTEISKRTQLNFIIVGILSLFVLFFSADVVWTLVHRDGRLFYDDWAQTRLISTAPTKAK
ncbi:VanZ family protein [Lacticaseibacillus zhaodongensis]|uniref:VanZ family protein n=1 Tax=Lacticaseibacillus zhaodongensis TaxID=2668065 RepID=UPI0012D35DCF|nr:VanZ family protein [Lacticaseibacillus zhaodongensis]